METSVDPAAKCPMCGAAGEAGPVCSRCSAEIEVMRESPAQAGNFRLVKGVLALVAAALVALGVALMVGTFGRDVRAAEAAARGFVQSHPKIHQLLGDPVEVQAVRTLNKGATMELQLRGTARIRGIAKLSMANQADVWWVSRGTLKIGEKAYDLSLPPAK